MLLIMIDSQHELLIVLLRCIVIINTIILSKLIGALDFLFKYFKRRKKQERRNCRIAYLIGGGENEYHIQNLNIPVV